MTPSLPNEDDINAATAAGCMAGTLCDAFGFLLQVHCSLWSLWLI